MELHERLVTTKPATTAAAQQKEPFADLKNSIHMLVISELGPQLTGQVLDPVGMRAVSYTHLTLPTILRV